MPSVFISYRQLDDAQRRKVRDFAERLRSRGVDVTLDQFYKEAKPGGPPEGWPKWSSDQAIHSERVLVVGNTPWFHCFDGKEGPGTGLGAACEAGIIRQRLYDLGGMNDVIRVVYFDKPDLEAISFELKRYDRFHVASHFEDIVAWLGVTPPAATSPRPDPATLTWPSRCPNFKPNMANRHEEFAFFADTLCDNTSERATIISADTDHGKTKLVSEFHRYGCAVLGHQACSLIDFKARGTVDNLWDTIALDLGHCLPGLGDRSPTKLRDGLRRARQPVLFIFDTFEQATEDARDFVQNNFFADLGRTNAMRLLIAGQPHAMPDPAKAAWQAHARRFNLGNMPDPKPWVAWAARVYPLIPASSVITIVACSGGAPGTIATQLAHLGQFTADQLKALGL